MFKLILGLSLKDVETSIKIAKEYNKLGIDMIDCSPSILPHLKKELANDGISFCVSIALKGDIHNKKAKIDINNCVNCLNCFKNCSQNAIRKIDNKISIDQDRCVGCQKCKKNCKHNAIEIIDINPIKKDFETIKKYKPDFLEIHLSIEDKKDIIKGFKEILKHYDGNVSICLSRRFLGTQKAIELINKLYEIFKKSNKGKEFLIQADGKSLNNASKEYESNLEALAFYNELKELGYKIIISGGLNDKTIELCKLFNLKPYGLGFGTYARKLIQDNPDKAKKLVDEVKEFYGKN